MPISASRRLFLAMLGSTMLSSAGAVRAQPRPENGAAAFGFGDVERQARELGERPFDAEIPAIPEMLKKLTYDSYREIRFLRDKAFWQNSGADFRLHLFHLGFLHDRPVEISIVRKGPPIPIPFTRELFEYGKAEVPARLSPALGFAGFAVTTTLNQPTVQDEVISFLGASYFRFLGREHRYALSARSLAIDIGGAQPEEFPFFRRLWLVEPSAENAALTIYALLDSPSVAGAFRFIVTPGERTTVDVTATLTPRVAIKRLGIAPLTSMFWAGEGDGDQRTGFRPEVHDSDGLMIHNGAGEWLWRPLANPKTLRISSFHDRNPRGFGLMQRDRQFSHYQDLEAHYHARPGYWVEPAGEWGEGRVDLIEIPTDNEVFDNIGCCWVPAAPLEPGRQHRFAYRITALSTTDHLNALGQAGSSFVESVPAEGQADARRRIIVDFIGGDLAYHLGAPDKVAIDATTSAGAIRSVILDPNPVGKGFRAMLDMTLPKGETATIRLFLKTPARVITEVWTTSWHNPA